MNKNELPTYELTAFNFAEDSTNKIHSDEVARDYGFSGGLVPGIAVYAYMTYPAVKTMGMDWLQYGTINAKFIKPVYDGNHVRVLSKRTGTGATEYEIQVVNSGGTLCAVGSAGLAPDGSEAPKASDYERRPLPTPNMRAEARAASLPAGMQLGTLDFHLDPNEFESKVFNDYQDDLSIYKGSEGIYHPAYLLEYANYIVAHNIALGPWIHTRSEVHNFASPKTGDRLSIRGRVIRAYEKQGHEFADFDLAIFDSKNQGIVKIEHTAIVHLKPK